MLEKSNMKAKNDIEGSPSLAEKRRRAKEEGQPTDSLKKQIIEEYKNQYGLNASFEARNNKEASPKKRGAKLVISSKPDSQTKKY